MLWNMKYSQDLLEQIIGTICYILKWQKDFYKEFKELYYAYLGNAGK